MRFFIDRSGEEESEVLMMVASEQQLAAAPLDVVAFALSDARGSLGIGGRYKVLKATRFST